VVNYLERGVDCLHMVQPMPLHPKTPSSPASFKSRLVLPFWYRLTQVVLEKRPLNGCSVLVVDQAVGHQHSAQKRTFVNKCHRFLTTNAKTEFHNIAIQKNDAIVYYSYYDYIMTFCSSGPFLPLL